MIQERPHPQLHRNDTKRYVVVNKIRTAGVSGGAPAYQSGRPNLYKAVVWIDPRLQFRTSVRQRFGDPQFDDKIFIPIESEATENVVLNMEVIRGLSWRDPGTSDGITVVGRGKITLPANLGDGNGRIKQVELVGVEDGRVVPKGLLLLSVDLVKTP